ncbi:MAG: sensor histidine kinase [Rhodanobacteraceae bacterium]
MPSRRRLRSRIILSYALLGFGLAILFAFAAVYVRNTVEDHLVGQQLQNDVDNIVKQVRADPTRPAGTSLVIPWIFSKRKEYKIPLAWQDFGTGVHDWSGIGPDGRIHHYKVAVRRAPDYDVFELYDVTRDELGKRQLLTALVATVILLCLLSLLIGVWLSARVMSPVTELAQRLRARRAGTLEPLAPYFAEDEVGELAAALDDYAERQIAMIARDREFNADVSHELRTPLAVIATTTELLMGNPELPDKAKVRLKRIERAVRQSTELTQALLLLSRAERSGPQDGETTDVAKVAAEVIDTNQQHIGHKPVAVRLEVEDVCEVEAPSSVVAVALGNLVGNACKYTLEGEVVVRVQCDRVLVEDTGPGIKPEQAEHLFERGVRGEGQTVKGAGLGLAIVRRLCELYGWRVSLAPRAERGAVATLDFQRPV